MKGSGSVAIVGGPANTIFSLIAKPEIKSFAELKGRMVAMSLPVDTISIASAMVAASMMAKPAVSKDQSQTRRAG